MRPRARAFALGAILFTVGARPVQAGIYNGFWSRSDGVFLTTTFDGSRHPQATISRGFCYDFFLNGDFIDLTAGQSENSGVITGLTRVKTLNGAQNSVNGHAIGQLQLHFCVSPGAGPGDRTIHIQNLVGEYDQLVVDIEQGGQWTSFAPNSGERVNIPFEFTIDGTDLTDANVEGLGLHLGPRGRLINTATRLRFEIVFDPATISTPTRGVFLRRRTGEEGVIRDPTGRQVMQLTVDGSPPVTQVIPRQLSSGTPPPPVAATVDQLKLVASGGPSLRHQNGFRKIAETFCVGFGSPSTADGVVERQITVNSYTLTVDNPTSGAFAGGATAQLLGPVPAPVPTTIGAIPSAGHIVVPFPARATSTTRVVLLFPNTAAATKAQYGGATAVGCFHSVMAVNDPLNWTDPPFTLKLFSGTTEVHTLGF